jgi:hypothetical protein
MGTTHTCAFEQVNNGSAAAKVLFPLLRSGYIPIAIDAANRLSLTSVIGGCYALLLGAPHCAERNRHRF